MAFRSRLWRAAIAGATVAATAVLIWFGTGLNPAWPLLWFAPLPALLYAGRANGWSTAVAAFAGWLLGGLNLWGYLRDYIEMPLIMVLGFVVMFAVVFSLAVSLYRALLRRGSAWCALLAFPAVWVTFEYLLNLAWPHGTIANLAYTQLDFLPFLQLASITGPWGMSYLVLLFPAAMAIWLHVQHRRPGTAWAVLTSSCGVVAAVLIFGTLRLGIPQSGQVARVGIVASDAAGYGNMAKPGEPAMRVLRAYAALVKALASRGANVVVLPEKVAAVNDAARPAVDGLFQMLSDQTGTTIVVGVAYDASAQTAYNQARIYTPFEPVQTYAKHHLLLPFESKFTPGRTLTTFATSWGTWGIEICKDMDFTQLSRQYGRLGVGLVLAPGLDFDVDRGFHGHMAIMRGVESGFAVARSGRHGYLTASDDRGRIVGQARSDSAPFATVLVNLPVTHDKTVFLAWGDWFAWVAIAALVAVLVRLLGLSLSTARRRDHA